MTFVSQIDEAEIRQLIDSWAKELRARRIESLSHDPPPEGPPFDMEKWFASWPGSAGREMRCLMIGADGAAYCHSVNCTGSGMWVRATIALRKIEGRWRVMQEWILGLSGSDRHAVPA
jgi:ketosteroid isomerase-like protein